MYKNVKSVFNDLCSNLKVDNKLCNEIEKFKNNFITRNKDHAEFFGGNLTGVHVVKFTSNDRIDWFENIIKTDEDILKPELNKLINPLYYKIAGDVFNLSCVWLAHVIRNSSKITNSKIKIRAQEDVFTILQFRFITSRMTRHWPFPCSKEVAEATLANMSNKYDIKRKGSWLNVITDRSKDIVSDKSIHKNTITKMEIDISNKGESVGYLLTDTQGRNKELLKNIYNLQKETQEAGFKINSSSATYIELDGTVTLKDKQKSLEIYKNYLDSIIGHKSSFIKLELVEIIERTNKTMSPQLFRETLGWISDTYSKNNNEKVKLMDLIDRIMYHLISYMYKNRNIMKNKSDVTGLISKMKGIYTSSKSTDETLLSIRKDLEDLVKKVTNNKSQSALAAVRTGILLYIILRTFTMNHYQG